MTTRKDLKSYSSNKYGKTYWHPNGLVIERFYHSWAARTWWRASEGGPRSKSVAFKQTLKELLAVLDESGS